MVTKEQIKQKFDERHAGYDDPMFRALDMANGIYDKSRTQNIRFGVRDFYNAHDVEAMFRNTIASLCEGYMQLYDIVKQLHGEEVVSILESEKIKEFLEFNENVEYIKELEKSL